MLNKEQTLNTCSKNVLQLLMMMMMVMMVMVVVMLMVVKMMIMVMVMVVVMMIMVMKMLKVVNRGHFECIRHCIQCFKNSIYLILTKFCKVDINISSLQKGKLRFVRRERSSNLPEILSSIRKRSGMQIVWLSLKAQVFS